MDVPPSTTLESAVIAFVDLAGFSAITDVHGDLAAVDVLERFEQVVVRAAAPLTPPLKWIGDEAMFVFPDAATAVPTLAGLIVACRAERWLPLTRTGVHDGPILRRGGDVVGGTVNVAARIAALARPGELLAGPGFAAAAAELGFPVRSLGPVRLRSVATPVEVHAVDVVEPVPAAVIDPVCKMHAPAGAVVKRWWFCSEPCAQAFARDTGPYM